MITLRYVDGSCGFCGRFFVPNIALGIEGGGIGEACGIAMDGPCVEEDHGAFGDSVAHVCVVFAGGMWEGAKNSYRVPAQSFFDASADIGEIGDVVQGGHAVMADDGVDFGLAFCLDVGEEEEGLNEAIELGRGSLTTGFP
jgi:hypothetical protein